MGQHAFPIARSMLPFVFEMALEVVRREGLVCRKAAAVRILSQAILL